MKLTETHVSDDKLTRLIITAEEGGFLSLCNNHESVMKALLELKQRRAEEREAYREANRCKTS
jgi:hypothetical protein